MAKSVKAVPKREQALLKRYETAMGTTEVKTLVKLLGVSVVSYYNWRRGTTSNGQPAKVPEYIRISMAAQIELARLKDKLNSGEVVL